MEKVDAGEIEKIIFRSLDEGVITLNCTGNIHIFNPAAVRILGIEGYLFRNAPFDRVFDGKGAEQLRSILGEVIVSGRTTTHEEISYTRPDGQTIDLAVSTAFLDYDVCTPGLQSVVSVFRDITAFKTLDRAKRRAINHLSHELRTPLAIILASTENLGKNQPNNGKFTKNLQRIKRNLHRLLEIQTVVETILNPPTPHPVPVELDLVITKLVKGMEIEFSQRNVLLKMELEPVETSCIDPEILKSVLYTLLKNAVENTPDEGEIVISSRREENGIILQIQDFGVGIPISDYSFLFEGFHHTQPDDEYSSKTPFDFNAGGKGLELLKLKIMAETAGFDVAFESRRCAHIPSNKHNCCGIISECVHIEGTDECRESGTVFSVRFR